MEYCQDQDEKHIARCLECGGEIGYGRTDKKFCSNRCKDRYHNQRSHVERSVKLKTMGALNKNYEILQKLLEQDIRSVDRTDLSIMGYNFDVVTSYHKVRGHNEFQCFDIRYNLSPSRIFSLERILPII